MQKINLADFGSGSQKLQQEDLEGSFAILTIAKVEQTKVQDTERQNGERNVIVLRFEETGDRTLWLNWVKEIKMVVTQLGDDRDAWVGQRVPVERVTRQYQGQSFYKVAIAEPAKWPEMMAPAPAPTPQLEAI